MLIARAARRTHPLCTIAALSTRAMASSPPVLHANSRFYAVMDDGAEALLEYSLGPGGVMTMSHTFCPPSARGKGMAGKLADAAFEWARKNPGVTAVAPSCSYIRDSYLPKTGAAAGFTLATPDAALATRLQ